MLRSVILLPASARRRPTPTAAKQYTITSTVHPAAAVVGGATGSIRPR